MSFIISPLVDIQDGPRLNGFGALRVAEDVQLFSSTLQTSLATEQWDIDITGDATTEYKQVESSLLLSVTTAAGDKAIRQTLKCFQYQPGRPSKAVVSACFCTTPAGIVKRIGVFDNADGLYFQHTSAGLAIVIRSTVVVGVTTETVIPRADWNYDKLDGTGPTTLTMDDSIGQVYHIDYTWHGFGRVRFGVVIDGDIRYVHYFQGNISESPYMGKGDLPIRYEIENVDGSATPSTLKQFSSGFSIEGGENPRAYSRTAFTPYDTKYRVPNVNNFHSLISVRIKAGFKLVKLKPALFDVLVVNDARVHAALFKNANLGLMVWQSLDEFTEYSVTNNAISGGLPLFSVTAANRSNSTLDLTNIRDDLNLKFDGTSETYCLAVRRIDGNADVAASFNFTELR